jgi:hypothetical protein
MSTRVVARRVLASFATLVCQEWTSGSDALTLSTCGYRAALWPSTCYQQKTVFVSLTCPSSCSPYHLPYRNVFRALSHRSDLPAYEMDAVCLSSMWLKFFNGRIINAFYLRYLVPRKIMSLPRRLTARSSLWKIKVLFGSAYPQKQSGHGRF